MRQRFTIDLNRYPYQSATIEITAEGLVEAQAKALDMARRPDFPWVTDDQGSRISKVIVHAGEVPDDDGGVDPEFKHLNADFMAKQKP
jgi:hypothetical protein